MEKHKPDEQPAVPEEASRPPLPEAWQTFLAAIRKQAGQQAEKPKT